MRKYYLYLSSPRLRWTMSQCDWSISTQAGAGIGSCEQMVCACPFARSHPPKFCRRASTSQRNEREHHQYEHCSPNPYTQTHLHPSILFLLPRLQILGLIRQTITINRERIYLKIPVQRRNPLEATHPDLAQKTRDTTVFNRHSTSPFLSIAW